MPQIKFKDVQVHPEGSYAAEVTYIEETETQYGQALKVLFTTEEGTQEALCSLTYSPKSKLCSLARAAFGQIPEDLDTDDLLLKRVGIVIEHYEKEGQAYSKVASFHRLKAKPQALKKGEDPFEKE